MWLIPAIYLHHGQCICLFRGDFSKETVLSTNPLAFIKHWCSEGAKRLHIVDLDGTTKNKSYNKNLLKQIISEIDVPIQFGGGVHSMEQIDELLGLGVDFVVMGSTAVHKPDVISAACQKYSGKIIVAVDVKDGVAAIDGWEMKTNISAIDLIKHVRNLGVQTVLYTDTVRDGTLLGLNIKEATALAQHTGMQLIVAGGLSSLDELKVLQEHEKDGICGALIESDSPIYRVLN